MGVMLVKIQRRNIRVQGWAICIVIPVFLPCHIGIMGMGKADRQAPWPVFPTSGKLIEFLTGKMGNLIIIFQLIGGLGYPCPGHRAQIMIPPVYALSGLSVIRRPAKISRVNIGSKTFFKTM